MKKIAHLVNATAWLSDSQKSVTIEYIETNEMVRKVWPFSSYTQD